MIYGFMRNYLVGMLTILFTGAMSPKKTNNMGFLLFFLLHKIVVIFIKHF